MSKNRSNMSQISKNQAKASGNFVKNVPNVTFQKPCSHVSVNQNFSQKNTATPMLYKTCPHNKNNSVVSTNETVKDGTTNTQKNVPGLVIHKMVKSIFGKNYKNFLKILDWYWKTSSSG